MFVFMLTKNNTFLQSLLLNEISLKMPSSFPFYPHMQLSFHNRCPLHAERRKETEINASGSFRTQQKGGWRSAEKTGKSENKPENKAGDEGLI